MPNLNLSNLTWDQVRQQYPDLYARYGPGSSGYVDTTTPTLPGAGGRPPSNYDPAYGGIPNIPGTGDTAANAIQSNLANLPNILGLAGGINSFQNQQSINPYIQNLPGYTGMMAGQSGIIGDQLKGMVPADVMANLNQWGAERGVSTGIGGNSPNTNAAVLRAMGLTSLAQQQTGMSNLQRAIGEIPTPALYDPSRMMVSPAEAQANAVLQSILASAPVPAAAAAAAEAAMLRGLQAGRNQIPPSNPGGGGGGLGSSGNPAGSGGWAGTPWANPAYTQPPAVGRSGYFPSDTAQYQNQPGQSFAQPRVPTTAPGSGGWSPGNYGLWDSINQSTLGSGFGSSLFDAGGMLGGGSPLFGYDTGIGSFDQGFGNYYQGYGGYEPDTFSPEWFDMMGFENPTISSGIGSFDQGFTGSQPSSFGDYSGMFSDSYGTPSFDPYGSFGQTQDTSNVWDMVNSATLGSDIGGYDFAGAGSWEDQFWGDVGSGYTDDWY
jgi:hypothetical protein